MIYPTLSATALSPVKLELTAPGPGYAGVKLTTPFTVSLSTDIPGPFKVDLYAEGSRSAPPNVVRDKWSHLVPQWRFLDSDLNTVSEIYIDSKQIDTHSYIATGAFYFIDDKASISLSPVAIWATADFSSNPAQIDQAPVASFVNSRVGAAVPYEVNSLSATHLTITRDGVNPLFPVYWRNATNHYIITINSTAPTVSTVDLAYNTTPIVFDTGSLMSSAYSTIYRQLETSGISLSAEWMHPVSGIKLDVVDQYGFNSSGYVRDSFKRGIDIGTVNICASATLVSTMYDSYDEYLWISNPLSNTLNMIFVPPSIGAEYSGPPISNIAEQTIIDTTALQVVTGTSTMSVTGFGGIFGLAQDGNRDVWATDAENDKVYKFDTTGQLVSTIQQPIGSTPTGITVDSQSDIWVTLFDAESAIKIDSENGSILQQVSFGVSPSATDPVYKPVGIETDANDDVWIAYSNPLYSSLRKVSSTGTLLNTVTLPLCSTPVDLKTNESNSVWVTLNSNAGPPFDNSGAVLKYDTSGSVVSAFYGYTLPTYLSIGNNGDIWFTHDWNSVSKIDTSGNVSTHTVGGPIPSIWASGGFLEHSALGGIATDEMDRVWVINSYENELYMLTSTGSIPGVTITPITKIGFYNTSGYTITAVDPHAKSAQAFGDWTGSQWHRKYGTVFGGLTSLDTIFIQGCSNAFDIRDGELLNVRRFNESWQAGNQIKEYAIAPHIRDNPVLWDSYMDRVWGTEASPEGKAFGRQTFERIANFTANHADINTCGVKSLYSLADATDVPIDQYGIAPPPVISRLLDISSVNQQILWGARDRCGQNITNDYRATISGGQLVEELSMCEVCQRMSPGNRGELFDPRTYTVSAGVPFIVRDKYRYGEHSLIVPPASTLNVSASGGACDVVTSGVSSLTMYSLLSAYHWLLPTVFDVSIEPSLNEFLENAGRYCFYDYVDASSSSQVAGVINWDDPYTTYSEHASSIQEWYGDFGAIEQMFNYELHKGLGLIY